MSWFSPTQSAYSQNWPSDSQDKAFAISYQPPVKAKRWASSNMSIIFVTNRLLDKVRKDRKNNAVREVRTQLLPIVTGNWYGPNVQHYSRCYHDQRAYHHEKQAARKHAGRGALTLARLDLKNLTNLRFPGWYHGFKRRMGVHQNKVVWESGLSKKYNWKGKIDTNLWSECKYGLSAILGMGRWEYGQHIWHSCWPQGSRRRSYSQVHLGTSPNFSINCVPFSNPTDKVIDISWFRSFGANALTQSVVNNPPMIRSHSHCLLLCTASEKFSPKSGIEVIGASEYLYSISAFCNSLLDTCS